MGPRKLTHEMLVAACAQTPHEVADLAMALAQRGADLEAQGKELTRQLHQNSRNSSKLPSSDGYTRNRRPKVGGRKAAKRAEGNRGILGPSEPCGMIRILWSCIRRPTVSSVGRISKTARPPHRSGVKSMTGSCTWKSQNIRRKRSSVPRVSTRRRKLFRMPCPIRSNMDRL